MKYRGGCHCGRIAFEIEGDLTQVTECNCSLCRMRGALHWFVPRQQLHLLSPETDMATYRFGPGTIKHHFCPDCGCAPFGEGKDGSGKTMAAINVRCLEDIDMSDLRVAPFDGRSL